MGLELSCQVALLNAIFAAHVLRYKRLSSYNRTIPTELINHGKKIRNNLCFLGADCYVSSQEGWARVGHIGSCVEFGMVVLLIAFSQTREKLPSLLVQSGRWVAEMLPCVLSLVAPTGLLRAVSAEQVVNGSVQDN